MIAAGPPCEEYSTAKTVQPRNFEKADEIIEKTLEVIRWFDPPVWWLENPRRGYLKSRECIRHVPFIDDDYCQFSDWGYQKPTRIWGCESIAELDNRLCDGFSCPNLERTPDGHFRHKESLGGWGMKHGTSLKSRTPAALVE